MLVYNDSLSQLFNTTGATTIGYYWWVAEGTTLLPCIYGTPFLFDPVINTDDQTGFFYLDYTIGDNGDHLIYDRSDDHMIGVGMPNEMTVSNSNDHGPGSLREAIDLVGFYGNIYFDLNDGDTIFLQDELNIYKDVHITGPADNPVVISGNYQNRVMSIDDSRCPQLSNLHIVHGNSDLGGGIYCGTYSTLYLKNVTVSHNQAISGGGLYASGADIILDSIDLCNIFLNQASSGLGADIQSTFTNLIVDTFSVLYPNEFYLYPPGNFICNIQNCKIDQVDADLYVSPSGDNSNSGLTAEEPLKTIRHAFSLLRLDSLHQNTIRLLNGTYSPSSNGEPFPINMLNYLSLAGESGSGVVLDAEGLSYIMAINNDSLNSLSGMTLTGGFEEPYGHAIRCDRSNVFFHDVTITNNKGGGIRVDDSYVEMEDVSITNNTSIEVVVSSGRRGGGIYGIYSDLYLKNVLVSKNEGVYTGGGIFLESTDAILEDVTISYNKAYHGGGVYAYYWTNVVYDSANRCNIYLNEANYGNDIITNGVVVVDTFTVLHPGVFHAEGDIEFDILNGKIEQADCDLFVSPGGDDANSGLTPDDPLGTIRFAESIIRADDSCHHTIRLLDGTYGSSTNDEPMPIMVHDYISISGTSAKEVILDAEGLSGVMVIESDAGTKVSDLTLTGGNAQYGGGLTCAGNPKLENVIIRDNTAIDGAGIDVQGLGTFLKNVLITANSAQYCGGISCRYGSHFLAENITISDNTGERAGGIYLGNGSKAVMRNSIISGNTGDAVHLMSFNSWNYFTSSWSNINGWVNTNSNGSYTKIGICLNEDPLFVGLGDHPFALSGGSPCIDAGNPDTNGYNLPVNDLMGNLRIWDGDGNGEAVIDMGAYEYGAVPVGINQTPDSRHQIQVYPNPTSDIVNLLVTRHASRVTTINLHAIDGRKIRELANLAMPAGEYKIEIDVSDLPGGVYFIRVQAGSEVAVAKLLVVR